MPPVRRNAGGAASYALGLGANRARPRRMIARAVEALAAEGVAILAISPIVETRPLGPGTRRFANAAALVATPLTPPALLALAKRIERALGRRAGRRWGDRAIDIDLLLWRGGRWRSRRLMLPHPRLAARRFTLDPLARITPDWRLPDGRSVRQLRARLTARRPIRFVTGGQPFNSIVPCGDRRSEIGVCIS